MNNRLLRNPRHSRTQPLLLSPLHLPPVRPFKHTITSDMKPFPIHILLYPPQHLPIPNPRPLQQRRQILHAEMPIRTAVRLPRAGRMLRQDLLATIRRVAAAPPVRVAADVAVRVPDVVAVFLVEGVVGDEAEGGAPEAQAFVERQADAFEEEGVLQAAEVFEVRVGAEGEV